jgi:hypothetical protein
MIRTSLNYKNSYSLNLRSLFCQYKPFHTALYTMVTKNSYSPPIHLLSLRIHSPREGVSPKKTIKYLSVTINNHAIYRPPFSNMARPLLAGLRLLQGADEKVWYQAVAVDNLLQKTSPASARRMATLIRKRLEPMPRELWSLVVEGTTEVATQALLAAAIKHSRVLGDFMLQVLRRQYREFNVKLLPRAWDSFLVEISHVDPVVAVWSQSTKNKLGQVV